MSATAIRVTDLVKEYEVYERPLDLALEALTRRPRHKIFRALNNVSFEVSRGEVFGIIGANGAGKSTLLKIIAGVLDVTSGSIDIAGRVTAILELGLGFNVEYSGRENIYLSGLLYGMDKSEIDRKLASIIAFSGLGDFIERPVKTYSSGMQARLAFSVATAVDAAILIIDEALAAGDAGFVQKCLRRIRELCSGGRTVLMVSHGTGLLAQLCNRVMWLQNGQVQMIGSAIQVIQAYDLAAHQSADPASWIETVEDDLAAPASNGHSGEIAVTNSANGSESALAEQHPSADEKASTGDAMGKMFLQGGEAGRQVFRRGPVFIESVRLLNEQDQPTTRLILLKPFTLKIEYRVDGPLPTPTLGVALAVNTRHDLAPVAQFITQNIRPFETRESYDQALDRFPAARRGTITLSFDHVPFRKGDYILSVGLLPNQPATWEFYEYRHFYYAFSVDDVGMDIGAPIFLNARLTHRGRGDRAQEAARAQPAPASVGANLTTLRGEIEQICRAEGGYPERWPRHRCCPACGEGPLVQAFAKYGFAHVRCGTCGFVCVDPYPGSEIITKLYSGSYYSRVRELFERPLLEQGGAGTPYSAPRDVLEAVIRRATNDKMSGTWLDVGGGLGAFAHLIQKLKPWWQVKLSEFNPQSIAIARELFDVEIITADPAELSRQGRCFDVVSSVSVVEHIPLPLDFLKGYAALVRPGGWLVTVLPHFSHLNAVVSMGSSSNVVPPYHVSLFNENALRRLLGRIEGLEIVAVEQAGPALFQLIHHVDYGDYWDVEVPTTEHPEPRSFKVKPYEQQTAHLIDVLSEADGKMGDYFAERDGRLYFVAYCRKLPA
ncbi:MAG: ATP-binding cassette domain-containing protein [Xanthobacteraceae bacterium]